MKYLSCILIAVAMTFSSLAQARPFDEIKRSGKMIVASEGAYPPFNYFEGSKLVGFEIELTEAVAKKMGFAVEWKALPFESLLAGLRQDRWDVVVASFGVTEERAKAVDFAQPYFCSGGVIVSREKSFIATGEQLAGKTVAVLTGSTYMESARKIPSIKEVKNFPQDTDARSALMSSRVDAWISDRFVAARAIELNPSANLKMGGHLFVEKNAPAIRKGNPELRAALDKGLSEVMADGTYAALSQKYFKEDVRCAQ